MKKNQTILIVGGAGYIGSHTNKLLNQKGFNTIIYDNLVYGHEEFVKWGRFIEGDLGDSLKLRELFQENNVDAVIHFAAYAYVGESVSNPEKYYLNNVVNTLNFFKIMREFNVNKIVFSSTCSTFGAPQYLPIDEDHPQTPINPYGQSKLFIEKVLKDYSKVYDLSHVVLRYFNAAGADPDAELGEWHNPETHLIPLVFDSLAGQNSAIKIFGADYDTPDGTCIRDYVHVQDLAQAHYLSLNHLLNGGQSDQFNLGTGVGHSVREVVSTIEKVTNKRANVESVGRREGDPASLIASSAKINNILGWTPFYTLDDIIESAWHWHQGLPNC
jgi:UDP-glucose 4-epimerase